MGTFKIIFTLTLVLTIATKIGFILQRVYVDIRAVALASLLAVVTGVVLLGYPILAALIGGMMFLYLLCRIGQIELMPDALFSTVIGIGAIGILVLNNYV